jgi:hypothetical protein
MNAELGGSHGRRRADESIAQGRFDLGNAQ